MTSPQPRAPGPDSGGGRRLTTRDTTRIDDTRIDPVRRLQAAAALLLDALMRCTSILTLVNEPRRMALSVINEKKRST